MADSPPGLIIRAATSSDVPALCSIANDPGYRWGTMRLPYQSPEQTARWFSELGVDDHLLVAVLDGEVVGNGGLHHQRGRRAHVALLGMGLREPVHRRGVGTALLAALIDLADDWLNLKRLELTVFVDNQPAITLYERLGFVRGGLVAYAFRAGQFVDALAMARVR